MSCRLVFLKRISRVLTQDERETKHAGSDDRASPESPRCLGDNRTLSGACRNAHKGLKPCQIFARHA
jgi:hypothetical protein